MSTTTGTIGNASAREEILNRIKVALSTPSEPMEAPDFSQPIYDRPFQDRMTEFCDTFVSRKASLFRCEDEQAFRTALADFVKHRGFNHIKIWEPSLASLVGEGSFPFSTSDIDLHDVEVGITYCEVLIARTGSFITTSKQTCGRRLTIYPPTHIVVAYTDQLVDDIQDGFKVVRDRYGDALPSMIGLVTGASRTADIEKTLVLGAHGPKELIMFLINR